jgi:hypothetical protein
VISANSADRPIWGRYVRANLHSATTRIAFIMSDVAKYERDNILLFYKPASPNFITIINLATSLSNPC